MANPERGEVNLVVNKRRFILLLDIEAITAIERVSGERLAAAVQRLSDAEFPIRLLVLFATAMLARRHPDLTAGMIGELVEEADPTTLRLAIFDTIRVAFPNAKPEAERKAEHGDGEPAHWEDLLPEWLAVGWDYELFWRCTPRQIDRHMIAAERRRERQAEVRRAERWTAAALARADKLPDFETFVHAKPADASSLEERMRKTMGGLALRMGRRH